jgi:indolepyruvate ferredoxin oxidoreductase alpha subunit
MSEPARFAEAQAGLLLMGDEAVARGALDAGVSAAYAYPGTPSTEAFEYLMSEAGDSEGVTASWCANEKTAYEQALGVSMVGRRALVVMKHVGLNVAADPFINSAIVSIHGGLVLAVADDPGMHSSQNEQDSRFYADFARIVCFEPSDPQEAYDMTREAFELSERFRIPVMVRLVTRLAHSRSRVETRAARSHKPLDKTADPSSWILLPANARKLWRELLDIQEDLRAHSESSSHNPLESSGEHAVLGVITTGIARGYYQENLPELGFEPPHLHVGVYPLPVDKIRRLVSQVDSVLVLEEGFPLLEGKLRGILPTSTEIRGKESGDVPLDGELTPDSVRRALGLPDRPRLILEGAPLPPRPPRLCKGCPHQDSFTALRDALSGYGNPIVNADIGCYTLGALPPYHAIESCVCMGAAVGMAKGAADAGLHPVVSVIGDSTFLHSGVTALMDAVHADTDMTLLILDNGTVGMTGGQETVLPSSQLEPLILGLGVSPRHCHVKTAHPNQIGELSRTIRREVEHCGLSVVIAVRECIEHAKMRAAVKRRRRRAASQEAGS